MGSRFHRDFHRRTALNVACLLIGLVVVVVVADARPAYSTDPPVMRVEPASTKLSGSEAAPGAVFTVEIVVEGVTNLGAFEFEITTDTTFFKYGDFSVAPFFNSSGRSASCLQRVGDDGSARFGCTTQGEPPGPDGTGVVATIDLIVQGIGAGETLLLLSNCSATDVLAEEVLISRCKSAQLDLNLPTPTAVILGTPAPFPRMAKLPALQNVWLTRQGDKIPPPDCLAGADIGRLSEGLSQATTSPDPNNASFAPQIAAFEFEVHYDATKVCVGITSGAAWSAAGAVCLIEDSSSKPQLEGVARIGCITIGKGLGIDELAPLALIDIYPQPEIYSQAKPNQDNGVVVQINNVDCDLSDEQGHAIPIFSCEDVDITFRYLEGDVDADCDVDAFDAAAIAFRWGAEKGSLIYNDFMNLEPSGTQADDDIDVNDLQFVYGRVGSTCDDPHPPQEPVNPKGDADQIPTATPGPTPTPTPTPTPLPAGAKPRINVSPDFQTLLLTSPPPSGLCSDSPDPVTFEVIVKDPITTEDPKDPSQFQILGAFEFELQYDEMSLCVDVRPGPIPQGQMNCITQQAGGVILYGCTTVPGSGPPAPQPPGVLAEITVWVQSEVYSIISIGQKRVFELVTKNCRLSDLLGHRIKSTGCSGATISVRYP